MNVKQQINRFIKIIQDEKKLSRTNAIKQIVKNYEISYATIMAIVKYGRKPKQQRLHLVVVKIINDYS